MLIKYIDSLVRNLNASLVLIYRVKTSYHFEAAVMSYVIVTRDNGNAIVTWKLGHPVCIYNNDIAHVMCYILLELV